MPTELSTLKQKMRLESRALRKAFASSPAAPPATLQINTLITQFHQNWDGVVIAAYQAIGSEVDLAAALQELRRSGGIVCLPEVTGPPGQPLEFEARPDIVLVPLLAFDRSGGRLGQGGGYYDATLAHWRAAGHCALVVGVGYACQEVPEVPREDHDQLLDWIVTELGAYPVRMNETDGTGP